MLVVVVLYGVVFRKGQFKQLLNENRWSGTVVSGRKSQKKRDFDTNVSAVSVDGEGIVYIRV